MRTTRAETLVPSPPAFASGCTTFHYRDRTRREDMVPVLAPQNPLATAGLVLGFSQSSAAARSSCHSSAFRWAYSPLSSDLSRAHAPSAWGRVGRGKAITVIVLGIVSLVWLVLVVAAVVVTSAAPNSRIGADWRTPTHRGRLLHAGRRADGRSWSPAGPRRSL